MVNIDKKVYFYSGTNPECDIVELHLGFFLYECDYMGFVHKAINQSILFERSLRSYSRIRGEIVIQRALKKANAQNDVILVNVDEVKDFFFEIDSNKAGEIKTGVHKLNKNAISLEWIGVNKVKNHEFLYRKEKKAEETISR